jgi:hypothetical protein
VSAAVMAMANPFTALNHLVRIGKAVAAYLSKSRFVEKHPCVTDLLEEAGYRFERRRYKGQSIHSDGGVDAAFYIEARTWAKASGISDNSISYFVELGKAAYRRGGRS